MHTQSLARACSTLPRIESNRRNARRKGVTPSQNRVLTSSEISSATGTQMHADRSQHVSPIRTAETRTVALRGRVLRIVQGADPTAGVARLFAAERIDDRQGTTQLLSHLLTRVPRFPCAQLSCRVARLAVNPVFQASFGCPKPVAYALHLIPIDPISGAE